MKTILCNLWKYVNSEIQNIQKTLIKSLVTTHSSLTCHLWINRRWTELSFNKHSITGKIFMVFTMIRKYGAVFHGKPWVAKSDKVCFDALFAPTGGRHQRIMYKHSIEPFVSWGKWRPGNPTRTAYLFYLTFAKCQVSVAEAFILILYNILTLKSNRLLSSVIGENTVRDYKLHCKKYNIYRLTHTGIKNEQQ